MQSRFIKYVKLASAMARLAPRSAPFHLAVRGALSDELKGQLAVARAEGLLADARASLAPSLTLPQVSPWMHPAFFPSPELCFAATLSGDFRIPSLLVDPSLQPCHATLQRLNKAERFAIWDAMEAAWYQWLPSGATLAAAFAAYGMPLLASGE